ncbi:MAG: hypothetical protein IT459_23065 [Planctomycetes bacterium]|nr:hypothetical protein [Planctomycetota bacterium]
MRRHLRIFVCTLVVPLVAAPLRAQFSAPHSTIQNQIPISSAIVPTGSPITSMVSGDFTGHGVLDAAFIVAGHVVHVGAPGVMDSVSLIPGISGVNDLCSIDPQATLGTSALATVGPDGLRVWQRAKATGAWADVVNVTSPLVQGGTALASGDLDGSGLFDTLVVAADRLSVYAFFDGGTTPQMLCQATALISDVQVGNFDLDSQQEFALLTDTGVSIRDSSGDQMNYQRCLQPGGAITPVLLTSGAGHQFVAYVHKSQNAQDEVLHLLDGVTTLPSVVLGPAYLPTIAITAADREGDGDEDLLLSLSNTTARTVLKNSNRAPYFSTGDVDTLAFEPLGTPLANSQSALFGNFDGDDAADVFAFCRTNNEYWLRPGDPIDPVTTDRGGSTDYVACTDGLYPPFYSASYQDGFLTTTPVVANNTLFLLLDREAWGWGGTPAPNAFEVFLWRKNAQNTYVLGTVRAHYVFQLFDSNGAPQWVNPNYQNGAGSQPGVEYLLKLPIHSDDPVADDDSLLSYNDQELPTPALWESGNTLWTGASDYRFYIEIRAVHYNAVTGSISNKKRLYVAGLVGTNQSPPSYSDSFNDMMDEVGAVNIPFNCGYGDHVGGGTVKLGGFVAMSALPDFGNGNPTLYFTVELVSGF